MKELDLARKRKIDDKGRSDTKNNKVDTRVNM
jgi:hypothetical protein